MEEAKIYYSFKIGNFPVNITADIVVQWVVILVVGIIAYLLTRNLKRVPDKKQVILETIYDYVCNLVKSNMGESFMSYLPYVGTLVIYLLSLNLLGLIGVEPPTKNLSVTLGLGISSFLVINGTAIKRNSFGGYMKGLVSEYPIMLPLNILERITLPISLALRLFGNMLAATLLISLIYQGLGSINFFAQIGLPIVAHAYFDLFDGTIQMLVFTMLTIVYIKIISDEH